MGGHNRGATTVSDELNQRLNDAVSSLHEQLEKELHGAWRAGYNYLHVYSKNPMFDGLDQTPPVENAVAFTYYVYPSDSANAKALEHNGIQYAYSYDFTTIPDHIVKAAIDGTLDVSEAKEWFDE
jgi:hypothetical protein